MDYEVVKGDNVQDALDNATFKVGDVVRIKAVKVSSNSDKTFTIRYKIEPIDKEAIEYVESVLDQLERGEQVHFKKENKK